MYLEIGMDMIGYKKKDMSVGYTQILMDNKIG